MPKFKCPTCNGTGGVELVGVDYKAVCPKCDGLCFIIGELVVVENVQK